MKYIKVITRLIKNAKYYLLKSIVLLPWLLTISSCSTLVLDKNISNDYSIIIDGNNDLQIAKLNNDNIYHGTFRKYHSNGTLAVKGKFKNGIRVGTWKYYNENGYLTLVERYVDGEPHVKRMINTVW